ncbi:MAG: hypothetical protein ACPHRO_05860 [Nannocystaceae bacterium]
MEANTLYDLSGLGWLGDNTFVAVHDAKNPDELSRPRVSLLTSTDTPEGLLWRAVELSWPEPLGPSSDLESASIIPGTGDILIAESGDDAREDPAYQRLFQLRYDGEGLTLVNYTMWPMPVFNVEAHAIAAIDGGFIFVYAERAEGDPTTEIHWASFNPDDLSFGAFSSVTFDNPDPMANRPIVGMDFDSAGSLYTVAAFDPDVDYGPYSSSVWRVGSLESNAGAAEIVLDDVPERLATLDGSKVESVVVDDTGQIYIGTDDEDLGNVLRPLP